MTTQEIIIVVLVVAAGLWVAGIFFVAAICKGKEDSDRGERL